MYEVVLCMFFIVAIGLIALVLIQKGSGLDIGISLNSGASGTLLGSIGSDRLLTRVITILATLFFIISIILGNLNNRRSSHKKHDLVMPIQSQKNTHLSKPTPILSNNDMPQ
ncbi:preprotein translocase subunit SecG [Candidatus Pantoea carbekii]|uniref:Protein-export membrane protein SecG n=1 Tax=Candidatus Pantoea carbekii TaxID=1235990 RepID=U3U7G6_9GAMM|nr:preprotein translocase subunit SecG [Candidatus Pantoea carbekii]AKC32602.1 protein-export membrane protein SecG [Candidatus Pantoea carbekii]BAO00342.1 hypothetical protein HHS_03720 [Candidatus Pantoea carbekii]